MRHYECTLLQAPDERLQAAGVATRALRDNPVAMAISQDPLSRLEMPYAIFRSQNLEPSSLTAGARIGEYILAMAGAAAPGQCISSMLPEQMRSTREPEHTASDGDRMVYAGSVMADHDLLEPHWHIGPVGVEPGLQGMGVGKAVMRVLCDNLDQRGSVGWLETDKPQNIRFYVGLGFELVEEAPMLSARFWFMRRDPR